MTAPNTELQAARLSMRMSQDDLARAIRDAGERLGAPNSASKRLVQRWESGVITSPRPVYARALEAVIKLPIEALGFDSTRATVSDGHGGHDLVSPMSTVTGAPSGHAGARGTHSGVWLSRYEYYSSGRDAAFASQHYVVVLQHADQLTVRSLPESAASSLTIDLTVDGSVITGTWMEHTDPSGYYRGARYHGAIQMVVEPTGRRMAGKWVGFGKDHEINTGPWELVFQDASTTKATLDQYNRHPPE